MPISAMSISSNTFFFSSETYNLIFACRLDPIIFSALFNSKAPVITLRISLMNYHFSDNFSFLNLSFTDKKFSK